MTAIYKKEMRTYFTQMAGYIFLAFLLLLIGIWFTAISAFGLNPNFQLVLGSVTIFFFILIPALTMRLFSEEAHQKTDQLLLSSPLSVTGIVLGKFFAAFSLFLLGVAVSVLLPLLINNYGTLPVGLIVGSYIGFILLGASCIAVGVFISVLTDNQMIAAVGSMGAILMMFLMDFIAASMPTSTLASLMFVALVIIAVAGIWYNSTRNIASSVIVGAIGVAVAVVLYLINNFVFDGIIVRFFLWFSVFARYENFERGILNRNDIVYYITFIAMFIYLTINVIEKRRWR